MPEITLKLKIIMKISKQAEDDGYPTQKYVVGLKTYHWLSPSPGSHLGWPMTLSLQVRRAADVHGARLPPHRRRSLWCHHRETHSLHEAGCRWDSLVVCLMGLEAMFLSPHWLQRSQERYVQRPSEHCYKYVNIKWILHSSHLAGPIQVSEVVLLTL